MREDGLHALLQGFSTTDTFNITTVHSSFTSDERTFIILCTVNTVAHVALIYYTVELICTCAVFVQN